MSARKSHYTCWSAHFALAAELSRRSYDVAFTLGNTQTYDLFCSAPDGKSFKIQVKGVSANSGPWVSKKFFDLRTDENLFLVVVVVPPPTGSFGFFILRHKDAKKEFEKMPNRKRDGRPYTQADGTGLRWGSIIDYKDNWRVFP